MRNHIAAAMLAVLSVAGFAMPAQAQDKPLTDVTLTLDFVALGRHAPWYVAQAKGYFKQAGLNVKIIPGQGTAQALQALESNVAQFAFSDVASAVIARARGASTAKFVAVNYQKAPYAVFSLNPGANAASLDKLKGLEIASSAGSFTPKVIQGFMKEKNVDAGGMKFTNVDGAARVGMLIGGKMPAIETFIFAEPGIKAGLQPGQSLVTLFLGDQGLDLYANGLLVRDAYLKSNPELVRGFVRAALQGWKDTLANPEEAAKLQVQIVNGLKPEVVVAEIGILKNLAASPDVSANGLGSIDPARMKRSIDFVVQNIGVDGAAPAAADVYTTDFLPKPGIKP